MGWKPLELERRVEAVEKLLRGCDTDPLPVLEILMYFHVHSGSCAPCGLL